MKRNSVLIILLLLILTAAFAFAEEETIAEETANSSISVASEVFTIDFSSVYPDNPAATPVAVDPIDKPTPTPLPTPNYVYTIYENSNLGVSFAIPNTWLQNPATDSSSTVQFVEPQSEMMDTNGYQTRITIECKTVGVTQTVSQARTYLEETLETLSNTFTTFVPGNIASATIAGAKGSYCYYRAEYTDGNKTYLMNGRLTVVAYGNALYQIRLTAPRNWYSYYENVFRRIRTTWKFL